VKQLSGLDASFLYMETDTSFGHVNGLFIYGRPAEDFDPLATVRARFGLLVGELPPFRRRLVEVPFKLDHPYWIDDSDFDLIRKSPVGGQRCLTEVALGGWCARVQAAGSRLTL
jgi:hypothetical protein